MAGFKVNAARTRKNMVAKSFGDGQIIQITYMPSIVTTDEQVQLEDKLKEATSSEETRNLLSEHLKRQVTEWNLENDDGSPLPINEEAMGSIPMDVLNFIMNMISEDKEVGKQKGNSLQRRS